MSGEPRNGALGSVFRASLSSQRRTERERNAQKARRCRSGGQPQSAVPYPDGTPIRPEPPHGKPESPQTADDRGRLERVDSARCQNVHVGSLVASRAMRSSGADAPDTRERQRGREQTSGLLAAVRDLSYRVGVGAQYRKGAVEAGEFEAAFAGGADEDCEALTDVILGGD